MIGSRGKPCKRCGADEWYNVGTLEQTCAPCRRAYSSAYQKRKRHEPTFRAKNAAHRRRYRTRTYVRERERAYDKQRRSRPEVRERERFIQRGRWDPSCILTMDQYQARYEAQNESCKICGTPALRLHVDHCHDSNRIRGLLCKQCNLGLGHFRDRPEILRAAASYLEN